MGLSEQLFQQRERLGRQPSSRIRQVTNEVGLLQLSIMTWITAASDFAVLGTEATTTHLIGLVKSILRRSGLCVSYAVIHYNFHRDTLLVLAHPFSLVLVALALIYPIHMSLEPG